MNLLRNPDCVACELHKTCSHVCLIGEGNSLLGMLIGEAPGADEDEKGRPFIGRAGTLLTDVIQEAGASREDFYITNTVKCRPPNNRTPTPKEILACSEYLFAEFITLEPKVILLLGNTPLHAYTNICEGISKNRGRIPDHRHVFSDANVFATFHPAAALRSSQTKKEFIFDINLFVKFAVHHAGSI